MRGHHHADHAPAPPPSHARLGAWLSQHKDEVLSDWERAVRALPKTRSLDRAKLLDHLPHVLEEITQVLKRPVAGVEALTQPAGPADAHAYMRLDEGFDLRELAQEYGVLRASIFQLLQTEAGEEPSDELVALNSAIDQSLIRSVTTYADAHERTIRALERISAFALTSDDVDRFLPRILETMVDTTPAVDSAFILLSAPGAADGALRVQTAVGEDPSTAVGQMVKLGEGASGRAARDRAPVMVRDANVDRPGGDAAVEGSGVHATYAVPLLSGDRLVGVAQMGSRTCGDFALEDRLLFRTMAMRTTALIVQAELRTELRRSEERHRAVVAALQEGIVVEDDRGEVTLINDAATRLLRLSAHEVSHPERAKSCSYLIREDGTPLPTSEWPPTAALRTGQRVLGAVVGVRRGEGSLIWLAINVEPQFGSDGRPVGTVSSLFDITPRKKEEEALRRGLQFRDTFIGIVGHDLRNPLTAIGLSTQVLLGNPKLTGRAHQLLERIATSADRMGRIITELLDFTRGRLGGGIPVVVRASELVRVATQVVEELRAAHPERTLVLTADGDLAGEWDPDRLAQVLGNLGKNAIDYSPKDSPVAFALQDLGAEVRIEVRNVGRVISEQELHTLFEPFHRGEKGRASQVGGLGLGLYISREIVLAHGGKIEVDSSAASGTRVAVTLPRHARSPQNESGPGQEPEPPK